MEITAAVAILAAAIAPFITALFTRPVLHPTLKRAIAAVVAVVLAIVVCIATGKVTGVPADWVTTLAWLLGTAAVIVSMAQGFYGAWKPAVEKVEAVTVITPADDDPDADL